MNRIPLWHEVSADAYQRWRRTFNADWNGADLMAQCPICGVRALHRWYLQEDSAAREYCGVPFKGRGRLWEWCSSCYTFEYLPDGFVPEWWTAPFDVQPGLLKSDPGSLEEARRMTR